MKNKMILLLGITSLCLALSGCASSQTETGSESLSSVEESITPESQLPEQETVESVIESSENETTETENTEAETDAPENSSSGSEEVSPEDTSEVSDNISEEALKNKLSESVTLADGQELLMLYDDFDENGEYEAFAFVGTTPVEGDELDSYDGTIWYVDNDECACIVDNMSYYDVLRCIDFGKRKYVCFDRFFVTESPTEMYTVKNGTATLSEYSGIGHVFNVNGTHFMISHSAYDVTYDASLSAMIGHSWKTYYFYYDSISDTICEIEAHEISIEEAKKLMPSDAFDQIAAMNGTVTTCILRYNGMLNVNYEIQSEDGSIEYCNANYDTIDNCYLDAFGNGNATLEGSNFGGTYLVNM